jgi:hypothetical protein
MNPAHRSGRFIYVAWRAGNAHDHTPAFCSVMVVDLKRTLLLIAALTD